MLSPDQAEKLHKAIDAAKHPGACQYTRGGEPCCVIGQLGALEGVSLEELFKWSGSVATLVSNREVFAKYPLGLLIGLQQQWDAYLMDEGQTEHTKQRMHRLVATAC